MQSTSASHRFHCSLPDTDILFTQQLLVHHCLNCKGLSGIFFLHGWDIRADIIHFCFNQLLASPFCQLFSEYFKSAFVSLSYLNIWWKWSLWNPSTFHTSFCSTPNRTCLQFLPPVLFFLGLRREQDWLQALSFPQSVTSQRALPLLSDQYRVITQQ